MKYLFLAAAATALATAPSHAARLENLARHFHGQVFIDRGECESALNRERNARARELRETTQGRQDGYIAWERWNTGCMEIAAGAWIVVNYNTSPRFD